MRSALLAATVAVLVLFSSGSEVLAPRPVSDVRSFSRQEAWRGGPRAERRVMVVTAYTSGPESTGKRPGDLSYGICASGAKAGPGAVAADPSVPFGTRVYVPGYGWGVVVDRGEGIRGDRLDVYFENVEDALDWGRLKAEGFQESVKFFARVNVTPEEVLKFLQQFPAGHCQLTSLGSSLDYVFDLTYVNNPSRIIIAVCAK